MEVRSPMAEPRWWARVRRFRRRITRFGALPSADRLLIIRALVVVGAAGTLLRVVSWPRARQMAAKAGYGIGRHSIERLVWAVNVTSRGLPWTTCLSRALAVQSLLANAGHASRLEIGAVRDSERRFEAHAWVVCGSQVIMGGPDVERYAPLGFWDLGARSS